MKPLDQHVNGAVIRYDQDIMSSLEPNLFDADWLQANQHWHGSAQGRGQAHFLSFAGRDMVLRHFCRGGLIGRMNRDLFLGFSADTSRSFLEFDLLCEMRAADLAVPRPVAARFVRVGPLYRADIITERIADADPLEDMFQANTVPLHLWTAIGVAIRKLHDFGVFHSDLNCRNILIDAKSRVWLIDFDKCEKRAPGAWMQSNLDRLHRSLMKAQARWSDADWAALRAGYMAERA